MWWLLTAVVCIIVEFFLQLLSGKGLAQKVRKLLDDIAYNEYLIAEYQKSEKAAQFKMMNIESFLHSMDDIFIN